MVTFTLSNILYLTTLPSFRCVFQSRVNTSEGVFLRKSAPWPNRGICGSDGTLCNLFHWRAILAKCWAKNATAIKTNAEIMPSIVHGTAFKFELMPVELVGATIRGLAIIYICYQNDNVHFYFLSMARKCYGQVSCTSVSGSLGLYCYLTRRLILL